MIRPSVLPLVAPLLLAFAHLASALEVREMRWGFDGKVVAGKFNILSVLVDESGPRPFDGEILLHEYRSGGSTVGAPQVQKVYVTPGTQRWVQFTPFIAGSSEWKLRWGKQESGVNQPDTDAPATVALLDSGSPFAKRLQLRGFAADLFPTSVVATDGLDQLVLDHAPRWDAPRREAFLDWLRRGGVVHVLRGADGYPDFEGDLAVLNATDGTDRVGAGKIARHDATVAECSAEFLSKAGFPPRGKIQPDTTGDYTDYAVLYSFSQTLLQRLASLTKPDVQWWLLYLLTIIYLVVIGPLHYRWSRKVDYRVAIAGFLGTVAAFAIAFIFAGSRGAGETQTAHTIAVARSLGDKRWDVMQWVSAFATTGDKYRLTHPAPWNLYSAPSETESVNGYVLNGKGGFFEVDIPLYSSRPFVHRGVMQGPAAQLQVAEWKSDRLALKATDLPEGIVKCVARRGERMLELEKDGDEWAWGKGKGNVKGVEEYFSREELQSFTIDRRGEFDPKTAFIPLAAVYYGDVKGLPNRVSRRPFADDQAQVLIWAKAPESFAMQGKGFRGEKGWVLYVIDVFRPAS